MPTRRRCTLPHGVATCFASEVLSLFVVQNLMRGATARDVTRGTTPYVILMIVLVVLLFLVPDLALWLPRHMTPAR